MKLSDTQTQILATAADHPHRLVTPPPKLAPAPREAIRKSLLGKGLIEPAALDMLDEPSAWTVDGSPVHYRITDAGRAAVLCASPAPQADMPAGVILAPAEAGAAPDAPERPDNAQGGQLAATGPAEGIRVPAPRSSLRNAAQALLAAWDDEAGSRTGLPAAIATLRGVLAGRPGRVPRDPSAPRQPRQGTKQAAVLALLRRPEGATVAQIAETTGWQTHTVRGFMAGLKTRQGIAVEVLERVRLVGPGKEGAKGSYSVYRIADAG